MSVIDPSEDTDSIVPKVIHKLCTPRTWPASLCEALVTPRGAQKRFADAGLGFTAHSNQSWIDH